MTIRNTHFDGNELRPAPGSEGDPGAPSRGGAVYASGGASIASNERLRSDV